MVSSFPLRDWILAHRNLPHDFALSGFVGALSTVPKALSVLPAPDGEALRTGLGKVHGAPPERIGFTHGATEANTLVLLSLAVSLRKRTGHTPRLYCPTPEYPPIPQTGELVGFALVTDPAEADAVAVTNPQNPKGTWTPPEEIEALGPPTAPILVDETFREFAQNDPPRYADPERVWRTGSFTKIYGVEDLHVGFAIPPPAEAEAFDRLRGLLLDALPPSSIAGALALLRDREAILSEGRALLRRNVAALQEAIDGVPDLAAPVWLDRDHGRPDGDAWARALLKEGVLVCPGSFFGDPKGVRICLTQRSFPDDLAVYLAARRRAA